ncbi:MAG: cellulase family glycosylhydrolase [Rufibacter sp.]
MQRSSLPQVYRWLLVYGFLLWLLPALTASAQKAPFNKGVNLTNWFQAGSVKELPFSRYTRKDFEQIKSLGVDVIRLPLNLHTLTKGAPNYTIEPLLFTFLDHAVAWAEELDLHLILDNHSFDPIANTQPEVEQILEKVWPQLAQRYKYRSDKLYYEILNEPHGISDALWNAIQGRIIQKIRAIDTKHYLIVGATNFNSYNNLAQLPVYADSKLIYTFHFYDPFLFTHQGSSWIEPSLVPLANMPFPYRAQDMPGLPNSLKGSWMESAYNTYGNEGTVARVKQLIDIAAAFQQARKVPVFCGEFGVFAPNSLPSDRVFWYQTVRQYLDEKNIAWTSWDYHGEFGLFNLGGTNLFEHDLNVPLLQALGFTVPTQTPYVKRPETAGFPVYTDYLGSNITNGSYTTGTYDFYADHKPNNGHYSLSWAGADRYNSLVFDFSPDKDLSRLKAENYAVDFLFRGTPPGTSIDVRFIDTKTTDPNDHPWRASVTLSPQAVPFDGKWHHVRLPLASFMETGSWDNNTWYSPAGLFDWTSIDRLEITAEHAAFGQAKLWFDNLYVSNQDTAKVYETSTYNGEVTGSQEEQLKESIRIYPNPAKDFVFLNTDLPGLFQLEVINSLGTVIESTVFRQSHKLSTLHYLAGTYYLNITSPSGGRITRKLIVLP